MTFAEGDPENERVGARKRAVPFPEMLRRGDAATATTRDCYLLSVTFLVTNHTN